MATIKKPAPKHQDLPDDLDDEMDEIEEGLPAWVITFADMVTLLLVFFILLFAIGNIEDEKWKKIKESLRTALGSHDIDESGVREGLNVINQLQSRLDENTINAVDEVGALVKKEIDSIASEVDEFVFNNKLAGQVQVSTDERGAIITIADLALFPAGKAEMTWEGKKTLKQIFDLLEQFDYHVKIEGHTDNSPINTEKFPSNWELSASRGSNVARQLIEQGFPPEKISVEGFAEFRPKAPNDSAVNRAINRRIEIVYQRGSIRKRMVNVLRKTRS